MRKCNNFMHFKWFLARERPFHIKHSVHHSTGTACAHTHSNIEQQKLYIYVNIACIMRWLILLLLLCFDMFFEHFVCMRRPYSHFTFYLFWMLLFSFNLAATADAIMLNIAAACS